MSLTNALPCWDMEIVFPSLQSTEFHSAFGEIERGIESLEESFHKHGIDKGSHSGIEVFDDLVHSFNHLSEKVRTVNAYVYAFVTTDSRDEFAAAKRSEIDTLMVRIRKLTKRFNAWVGGLDLEALLEASEVARDHEYALIKAKISANHMMRSGEEMLASELEISSSVAWSKLHSNITSQLMVSIEVDSETQQLPMSLVRTFAYDKDRERRKVAYEAELAAWKSVEVPLAAALNGIKGEVSTLCKHRHWEEPLDEALLGSNIDRQTLDAMMTAARESYPVFRRYLHAKAKALGIEKMAFYDIFAPLGESTQAWDYDSACEFVTKQFHTFSPKMGEFAARSFRENWVDVGPRPGKNDGAYCMSLRGNESRIFMNFKPSFGSVSTLAHELGHAYHNLCLADRTAMQRATPMTLAETASIFCETIIRQAVLKNGSKEQQLEVLEASLQGSCQVVVDISSRFYFEQSVFNARKKRELSAREMCEFMRYAQLDTYGDGLDPEALHPYMWAAKSHYYGRSYYNYPYMFGLLFGLGLYAVYQRDPEPFKEHYDVLLSSTGLADAASLGKRFGIDITTPDFWRASLDEIRKDVDRFEALLAH